MGMNALAIFLLRTCLLWEHSNLTCRLCFQMGIPLWPLQMVCIRVKNHFLDTMYMYVTHLHQFVGNSYVMGVLMYMCRPVTMYKRHLLKLHK